MYNYYQQQPSAMMPQQRIATPPIPQFGGLKGHPVSSLEEVKATSIDFDGSIFYFPDIANKRIYTKTVGMDGIASLNMYELNYQQIYFQLMEMKLQLLLIKYLKK